MATFTQKDRDMLIEMHTSLVGINGQEGLIKRVTKLWGSHYALKRKFYALIAFLLGSGAITTGILYIN